jgi:membrane protease YdiL (CAAX protease family)
MSKLAKMVILYFLICLILISFGALTKNFNYAMLFVLPIGLVAILFQKFIHKEKIRNLGFRKCTLKQIGKAIIFPLGIIFLIFFIDFILGIIRIKSLSEVRNPFVRDQIGIEFWTLIIILLISAFLTFIVTLISEELGFRGYLISRLSRFGNFKALLFSSLLFGLWHLPPSLILIGSGVGRSTIYVFNIFLLGILFGYLFLESKSLLPSSIFHGIWNALEYTFFGYGSLEGVFIGNSRIIFDPEEGLVGTAVLLTFSLVVLWKLKKK